MNKAELRIERLQEHYKKMQKLCDLSCCVRYTGKQISSKLLAIERRLEKPILDWANGVITEDQFNKYYNNALHDIYSLLPEMKGFFIDTDPRGYALKINLDKAPDEYKTIGLQTDWGGYALLAPVIDGN